MNNDAELLRRYVESKSDEAFTIIVQRHIGLVYATALRRVGGDTHLAEDVTQKVFGQLARKAVSLRHHGSIAGWLYCSAQYESAALVRSERRRKNREIEAHTMETILAPEDGPADWEKLRPVLDDAMNTLGRDDREAVILRFFQQRSFGEIGAALRLTDEAARKRVDRALDKLREILIGRGVTSTSTALGIALASAHASVPPQLTTAIATQALEHASVGGSSALFASVARIALPAVALVAVVTWLVGRQYSIHRALRQEIADLQLQNQAQGELRAEAGRLRNAIREADDLRRAAADLPRLREAAAATTPAAPPRNTATLTLTSQGTLAWGDEPVDLREFLNRLAALAADSSRGEPTIVVRAPGATYNALLYVIDEARKTQIKHVVIESDATPEPNHPKLGRWSWF